MIIMVLISENLCTLYIIQYYCFSSLNNFDFVLILLLYTLLLKTLRRIINENYGAEIIYYTDTPMTPLIDCLENSHLQIELSFVALAQTSEKLINKRYGRCASMKFVSLSSNRRQL